VTRLACDRLGEGPPVVLVHGVGVGPWSYEALARDLATDHRVVVAHRRGYGRSTALPPASSLEAQVDDLLELTDGPTAFIGVSGGATLTLALALGHPHAVSAAVVHEPVIGPLAPELHAELQAAAGRLSSSTGAGGTVEFMRALVGVRTWAGFDRSAAGDVVARAAVVRHEVPHFLDFSPTSTELAGLAWVPLVSTVGERSRPSRHLAAAAVAAGTGGVPRVLPGVGHLAQIEAPAALSASLRAAEHGALHGRPHGDQDILPAMGRDQLQPDR
jgi:pimeloyl-ACP methyl ester carboxylesterase